MKKRQDSALFLTFSQDAHKMLSGKSKIMLEHIQEKVGQT